LDFYVCCPQLNKDFLRYKLRKCKAGFLYQPWFSFLVGYLVKQRRVYSIRGAVFFDLKQKLTKI